MTLLNQDKTFVELCDKWKISGNKQIPFFIVGKKQTVLGDTIERLDWNTMLRAMWTMKGGSVDQGHLPADDDELWHDIITSIDEGAIIGQCSPQPSPPVLKGTPTRAYKGKDIVHKIDNDLTPTCMPKVKKPLARADKVKEKMTESDLIHNNIQIGFEDDDSDDNSFHNDMTYDDEIQLIGDVSAMSKDEESNGSDYSLVDGDEVFNHISEDEIDYYKMVYVGGKLWELEVDGHIVLQQRDVFEDKRHFLDAFKHYLVQEGSLGLIDYEYNFLFVGIIAAIETNFPITSRRICIVHYERNFRTAYLEPKLKALMLRAANACSDWSHNTAMRAIKIENFEAY
ncbi:LOW QUALITY PROTEIN: hypothetical protein Cgig2_023930 [Carnegiea gigantea]|uniref:Uncharacterized protein n=1 Tax=Carnegiea gigantea TaxID=171969 RepID=A0A9Q1K198_9CARY|nr:LOW QUALITY PROTEIN: hypothetical protein Cgig2_023930 [Carnegiea gigantea]